MHSLLSPIDHEARHCSNRADDEEQPTEQTPLIRFPQPQASQPRDPVAAFVVTLLFVVLISGVIIGIYLLVVQSNSENILPPINTPLQLVSRLQWDPRLGITQHLSEFRARQVIVVQTDTQACHTVRTCVDLLMKIKANHTDGMPYSFLVSSDGKTYEAVGWHRPSPMFAQHPSALVLAFIGNFTDTTPSPAQLDEARNFFAESVSLRHLEPSYTIIGKTTEYNPKYLFKSLSEFPHWNAGMSDKY